MEQLHLREPISGLLIFPGGFNKLPKKIFYCDVCNEYTLNSDKCPHCNGDVRTPHPPKFSPIDKYQKYRISLFKEKNPKTSNNYN
ncbi:MAG: RNA-protein complex protein Nop10 [Candidatus Lokiarchaeota archaeon]|nr:RNA-protein complex protein Nop10 [Candidatus Lokiarchaeota archaeon]